MPDPILNITEEVTSTEDLGRDLAAEIANNEIAGGAPEVTTEKKVVINQPDADLDFLDAAAKEIVEKREETQEEAVDDKPKAKAKKKADVKEEVKREPQEEVKAETSPKEEDVPEHELQVLPTDKPSTKKRIEAFLKKEKTLKEEAEKLRLELDSAKKQPQNQVNLEEIERIKQEHEAARDELTKYRRRYEIDNDPEFKTKFDEPIQQAEVAIKETLKKFNFSEPTIKAIEAEGGFAAFSRSGKVFKVPQEVDGEIKEVTLTAAQLAKSWLDNLPVADAEDIRRSIGDQKSLERQKKQTLEKEMASAKEYFTKREEESKKARENAELQQKQMGDTYEKMAVEAESSLAWLKDKDTPASATPEQKKEIEEYNKTQAELRGMFRKHPTKPEEYFDLVRSAVEARHLRREEASIRKELDAAKAEIAKLKGGMKTTAKSGSLMTAQKAQPKPKGSILNADWLDNLDAAAQSKINGSDDI